LLCPALGAAALQIVSWFVLRWQLEVTDHEVRAHLGVETQRQWSDLAILRQRVSTTALSRLHSTNWGPRCTVYFRDDVDGVLFCPRSSRSAVSTAPDGGGGWTGKASAWAATQLATV
jgi:hypothetical protein